MYAANNPINNSDPAGQWIIKDAIKWLAKNVLNPITNVVKQANASKGDHTYTSGVNGAASFGVGVSVSVGTTYDNNGNVGVIVTGAIGGGTPSASISAYKTETSAQNIYKQAGVSLQTGGSASIGLISFGAEYSLFPDTETSEVYRGGTALIGVSVPIPAEIHGEIGYSFVWGFNVYDVLDKVYIKIMEW